MLTAVKLLVSFFFFFCYVSESFSFDAIRELKLFIRKDGANSCSYPAHSDIVFLSCWSVFMLTVGKLVMLS